MLLNSSPAVGERDIDAILEDIQLPTDLLAALKPIPSCIVANFLLIRAPPRPGSRKYFLEASSWFSLESPNDKLDDVGDLILPSEKLCDTLDSHLRKAIDQGMCSVQHPVKHILFDAQVPALKPGSTETRSREREEKMGILGGFFGGYIPKITENRPFFGRYHTKNRKLALW